MSKSTTFFSFSSWVTIKYTAFNNFCIERRQNQFLWLILGSILLITACGPTYHYEQYHEIDNGQWAYADSLQFNFVVDDSTEIYDVLLEVDHSTEYKNQNLYIRIHTTFPNGARQTESLSLELSNSSTAFWEGKCSGDKCKALIPIQQSIYFNQVGEYKVTIEQYMRHNPVEGVLGIGFMLLSIK